MVVEGDDGFVVITGRISLIGVMKSPGVFSCQIIIL
jgi:hypothetical protein